MLLLWLSEFDTAAFVWALVIQHGDNAWILDEREHLPVSFPPELVHCVEDKNSYDDKSINTPNFLLDSNTPSERRYVNKTDDELSTPFLFLAPAIKLTYLYYVVLINIHRDVSTYIYYANQHLRQ